MHTILRKRSSRATDLKSRGQLEDEEMVEREIFSACCEKMGATSGFIALWEGVLDR